MSFEMGQSLVRVVRERPNCPSRLKQKAQSSWEALSRLPVLDQAATGGDAAPKVEQKAVTPDYLEFLR